MLRYAYMAYLIILYMSQRTHPVYSEKNMCKTNKTHTDSSKTIALVERL